MYRPMLKDDFCCCRTLLIPYLRMGTGCSFWCKVSRGLSYRVRRMNGGKDTPLFVVGITPMERYWWIRMGVAIKEEVVQLSR